MPLADRLQLPPWSAGGGSPEGDVHEQVRRYELIYIITPDATDQRSPICTRRSRQIVQRFGGTIEKTENWGRRKLAYEIGHHREGTYVLEVINGRAS